MPFIVRSHFGWGFTVPHPQPGAPPGFEVHRGGAWSIGVVTYFCVFGLVVEIDDWEVGAMFS